MRRFLRDIAAGRQSTGDATTLEDSTCWRNSGGRGMTTTRGVRVFALARFSPRRPGSRKAPRRGRSPGTTAPTAGAGTPSPAFSRSSRRPARASGLPGPARDGRRGTDRPADQPRGRVRPEGREGDPGEGRAGRDQARLGRRPEGRPALPPHPPGRRLHVHRHGHEQVGQGVRPGHRAGGRLLPHRRRRGEPADGGRRVGRGRPPRRGHPEYRVEGVPPRAGRRQVRHLDRAREERAGGRVRVPRLLRRVPGRDTGLPAGRVEPPAARRGGRQTEAGRGPGGDSHPGREPAAAPRRSRPSSSSRTPTTGRSTSTCPTAGTSSRRTRCCGASTRAGR